jgi:tetratricopeptide (TPR) repeat protein
MPFAMLHGRPADIAQQLATLTATGASTGIRDVPLEDSLTLAQLDVAIDQPARAVARVDAALAATPLRTLALADRDYLGIATIYAQAARPDKAKAVLAQRAQDVRDTAQLRSQSPLVARVNGEIAIAESRPLDAVRDFWKGDSLPDGPADDCNACTFARLARAYDKAGKPDSSIAYLERYFDSGYFSRLLDVDATSRAPLARRLGELYEAKGNRAKAAHYYQMFVDLWKTADPSLQPQVADVKKRLARLSDTEKP